MKTTLVWVAVLGLAPTVLAAPAKPPKPAKPVPAAEPPPPSTSADDEDEEDVPKKEEAPAQGAPKVAAEVTEAEAEPARGDAQKLVSGAPLYNPNVAVHTVQKKRKADKGRHELVLYPAAIQSNSKFTQHAGSAVSYIYHLHENFGLQVTPQYNWLASESSFNQELIDKVREEAQAATSLLLVWGVTGGVEVTPIYGKFAFYEGTLAHYTVVLNGGAGVGSTRHQLKPTNQAGPATYGETGMKFLGSVGGGFRVLLGERFALRLEVRDLVYTARVDSVNGCNGDDLQALNQKVHDGRSVTEASVSGGCKVEKFDGNDPKTGQNRSNDVPLANGLVKDLSSDVLNNLGFYAGLAILF